MNRQQQLSPVELRAGERAPVDEYDVGLVDLDGVVYTGQGAVPGAAEALAKARMAGMRLAFVTNNPPRPPSAVAAQLSGAGGPTQAADCVAAAQPAPALTASLGPAR